MPEGAWRAKKRSLPLPLAPAGLRVSANQEDTNVPINGNRSSSAKAHERNLAKLQLHLPREVLFFDPRRRVYHSHVDLSGWRVTDASLQQLVLASDQSGSSVKSSFHALTVDGSAHISARGLRLMLDATEQGGGVLRVLRLPQCQLLSRGGGELLEGSSLPRSLLSPHCGSALPRPGAIVPRALSTCHGLRCCSVWRELLGVAHLSGCELLHEANRHGVACFARGHLVVSRSTRRRAFLATIICFCPYTRIECCWAPASGRPHVTWPAWTLRFAS